MIAKAAVKIYDKKQQKEIIIPCHRHYEAFYILKEFGYNWNDYDYVQEGFLDEHDNFLSRIAAAKEAIRCQQVALDFKGELYSEDLW